ncbi:L-aminoadipate-semialdehyde dehydrogenase-phosphopantetheinyl transferase, partial [Choanephora cucurbitarum]
MYTFGEVDHDYKDALDLKHKATGPIAKDHNVKQTAINMAFDTVEDVEGFTSAVFKAKSERVFTVEPNFLLPRKQEELFVDYSAFEGDKFNKALSWLPDNEHTSVTRFKFERDRQLALASRLLRRHYFCQLLNKPWHDLEFEQVSGGKPFLKINNEVKYDYNTSHEGNWVIFGCVRDDMLIGVDVVSIDRPFSIDSFIKSFEPQARESIIWGLKESYIKALGVGLMLDLQNLDFYNQENKIHMRLNGKQADGWVFHLSYLDHSTLAVVCYGYREGLGQHSRALLRLYPDSYLIGEPLHELNHVFHRIQLMDIENNSLRQPR